ncbi:MAG: hypothetical protein K0U47_10210 [Epsilonproteobacteria bacterium]|nr:hypothetical protein [Campylobacterota bacterium]
MLTIIAKIIICMIGAALLGFIIGWIFSSLLRNEKHDNQILAIKEKFDEQKAQLNQLETDIGAKDKELDILKGEYESAQKTLLAKDMDKEEYHLQTPKTQALLEENEMLLLQIKEQQLCEDDCKKLKEENKKLKTKISALKEMESSYKENIARIAELESDQHRISPMALDGDISIKLQELEEENASLHQRMQLQNNCETEKEILLNEIEELLLEKQSLLNNIDTIKKRKNKTTQTESKKSIKVSKSQKNINDTICNEKEIIQNKDLSDMGFEEAKIKKVIQNLFDDKRKDT